MGRYLKTTLSPLAVVLPLLPCCCYCLREGAGFLSFPSSFGGEIQAIVYEGVLLKRDSGGGINQNWRGFKKTIRKKKNLMKLPSSTEPFVIPHGAETALTTSMHLLNVLTKLWSLIPKHLFAEGNICFRAVVQCKTVVKSLERMWFYSILITWPKMPLVPRNGFWAPFFSSRLKVGSKISSFLKCMMHII